METLFDPLRLTESRRVTQVPVVSSSTQGYLGMLKEQLFENTIDKVKSAAEAAHTSGKSLYMAHEV